MILSLGIFLKKKKKHIYIEREREKERERENNFEPNFIFSTSGHLDSYGPWIKTDLNFEPVSEFDGVEN